MSVIKSISLNNFRNFSTLDISNIGPSHVFMGPNGSGKTTILYAILLLLRGYNSRVEGSVHLQSNTVTIDAEEASYLFDTKFNLSNLSKLLVKTNTTSASIGGLISNEDVDCALEANGVVHINHVVDFSELINPHPEKIRYAFVGTDPSYEHSLKELYPGDIFTSSYPSFRYRYNSLSDETKENILTRLHKLFRTVSITPQDNNILLIQEYEDEDPVEILYTGSAFRKTFATYVLLYTLISTSESNKVFLMEEPDTFLYDAIQLTFIQDIKQLCNEHLIQLIITSNSHLSLKLFSSNNIHVLMKNDSTNKREVYRVSRKKWLIPAINKHLLAIPDKIIICEGTDDELFLNMMGPHFKVDISDIQILPYSQLTHKTKEDQWREIITVVENINPHIQITIIKDKDFKFYTDTSNIGGNVRVLVWEYPSIESYLFINQCQELMLNGGDPFENIRDLELLEKLGRKYCDSVISQNVSQKSSINYFTEMNRRWNTAMVILEKDISELNSDDIRLVAKVIHGHTWVRSLSPQVSSTKELILETTNNITINVPEIKAMLEQLFN